MRVRVLFFGILKESVGKSSDCLDLPGENPAIADVLAHYGENFPELKKWFNSMAVSLNQEYSPPGTKLKEGDEVALLPPVSGGAPQAKIVREPIDSQGVLDSIKRPEDGAAVVFEGIVRNHSRGRKTLYLEYEAYPEMAIRKMEALAAEAIGWKEVRDVAIIHRLGRLEIGETSVLIVVASAHRAAAFEVCRRLIDTLKRTVPIWKKEYFEDGAVWADGEPFPGEIPRAEGTKS
jgi:molybdopterin synthase catalytic subunit/molybdopterin converting factor small subunit